MQLTHSCQLHKKVISIFGLDTILPAVSPKINKHCKYHFTINPNCFEVETIFFVFSRFTMYLELKTAVLDTLLTLFPLTSSDSEQKPCLIKGKHRGCQIGTHLEMGNDNRIDHS